MDDQRPYPAWVRVVSLVAGAFCLVAFWLAAAMVYLFGVLAMILTMDRMSAYARTITTPGAADGFWYGGVALLCAALAMGVWYAVMWIEAQVRPAGPMDQAAEAAHRAVEMVRRVRQQRAAGYDPEMPLKTGPSPDEIARRGGTRG